MAYNDHGKIYDFGALEIQAVYISGNVREPFEFYMEDPNQRSDMNWSGEPNYPRPDYLSSSRKRLAPQLLFKGGILHSWHKKIAVALGKSFFETLPQLNRVSPQDADMAWFIYELQMTENNKDKHPFLSLKKVDQVFTKFKDSLFLITTPLPGDVEIFVKLLQERLDEQMETPPVNKTIEARFLL